MLFVVTCWGDNQCYNYIIVVIHIITRVRTLDHNDPLFCAIQVPVERHGHLVIGYQDLQKSEPHPSHSHTLYYVLFPADMLSQDIGPLLLKWYFILYTSKCVTWILYPYLEIMCVQRLQDDALSFVTIVLRFYTIFLFLWQARLNNEIESCWQL